jgi:hypothetical protein
MFPHKGNSFSNPHPCYSKKNFQTLVEEPEGRGSTSPRLNIRHGARPPFETYEITQRKIKIIFVSDIQYGMRNLVFSRVVNTVTL